MNIIRSVCVIACLWFGFEGWAQKPELVVQTGVKGLGSQICVAPQDKYYVTSEPTGVLKLWTMSGRLLRSIQAHSEVINSIDISPNGKYILTGSDDGSAAIWNIYGDQITRITSRYSIQVVQFSPNGLSFLTGGDAGAIKIYDLAGNEIQYFFTKSASITSACFSPDGQKIITSGYKKIQLWNLNGKRLWKTQASYGYVYAVSFSPDGQSIFSGGDGVLKRWDLAGELIQSYQKPYKGPIREISISSNSRYVVAIIRGAAALYDLKADTVSYSFSMRYFIQSIAFHSTQDSLFTIGTGLWNGVQSTDMLWNWSSFRNLKFTLGEFNAFAFSEKDQSISLGDHRGNILFFDLKNNVSKVIVHPREKKYIGGDGVGAHSDVVDLAISPDQETIIAKTTSPFQSILINIKENQWTYDEVNIINQKYVTSNPDSVFLYDGNGIPLISIGFPKKGNTAAALLPSEQLITGNKKGELIFWNPLGLPEFQTKAHVDELSCIEVVFSKKIILTGSINGIVKGWTFDGKELFKMDSQQGAIQLIKASPNGKGFYSASIDGYLKRWNFEAEEIYSVDAHSEGLLEIKISNSSRFMITSGQDKTAKLWNAASGTHLASIYSVKFGQGWIIRTPDGRFDGDEVGLKNLHYAQGLEAIDLTQLKDRYYEPGLLSKVMGFSDEPLRNVAAFDQLDLYPITDLNLTGQNLSISLTPRSGGIGRVAFFIGDKEVSPDINPNRKTQITFDLKQYQSYFSSGQETQIGIKTWNADDWLVSNLESISYTPPKRNTQLSKQTRLFALCIGTSNYQGESFDLSFADQDAEKVAQALGEAGQSLLLNDERRIDIQVLSTANPQETWPSKANIQAAMKQIAKQARPEDLFILYLSGHGTTNDRDGKDYFYYLTHELNSGNINDTEIRRQYAISTAEWADWLTAIPAQKQVMMLDACASGTFNASFDNLMASRDIPSSQIRALDRLRSRTGLFIISGSTADQVSYEASPFGQGLLTYSLLRGIKSGEALREGQYVDVIGLFNYAKETVPDLAKEIGGIQEPMIFSPYGSESYDIGRATPAVRNEIELSEPKPIFCRVRLNNEATFDDDQGLEKLVNEHLREVSKQGSKAALIFVDVADDPNAYRIVGRYSVVGENIRIQARVMRDGKAVGESFEVRGKRGTEAELGQDLVRQGYRMVE